VEPTWLERGLARLHGPRNVVVGGGLLIGPRHVVTCAHVAAAALGDQHLERAVSPGRKKFAVSFPAGPKRWRTQARIARGGWRRIEPGSLQGDIAVLELDACAPEECAVPPLLCPQDPERHGFVAKGFPEGTRRRYPGGVSAEGSVSGMTGPGNEWRQLIDHGMLIQPGFSGAPVWDTISEAVIGIVVARDHDWVRKRQDSNNAAFTIPLPVLIDTWEPLADQVGWRVRFDPQRELHWEPRNRGTEESDGEKVTNFFTGRRKALGELAGWLTEPQLDRRPRVLTGGAGAGKSSVLARLVMAADPDEETALEAGLPAPKPVAVAIVAREDGRGLTLEQIVKRIAKWADVKARTAEELVASLEARAAEGWVATIVVDQLDEAARPHDVISLVLRPLAERGAARVLVGLSKEDGGGLLEALGEAAKEIDLDGEYYEEEDLSRYVAKLLRRGETYKDPDDASAERVAAEVAAQAKPLFLVGRLVALYLAEEDEVAAPRHTYPKSVDAAMDQYVARIARRESDGEPDQHRMERKVRDLMGALAYAQGSGLPLRGDTWPAVAEALRGERYDEADVSWLCGSAARFLLQREDEEEVTCLRLFHGALAGCLKLEEEDAAVHGRITATLAGLCPADNSAAASPYVESHLSGHALLAGQGAWEMLASRPAVLDRLTPRPLQADAARAALAGVSLPPQLLGVLNSGHLMERSERGERAGLRQLGMARVSDRRRFTADDAASPLADWAISSAVLRRQAPHVTIPVDSEVRALTSVEDGDGEPLLVAACGDRRVRAWVASSGELVADVTPGDSELRALAACRNDEGPLVAVGDAAGYVHLLNPEARGIESFPSGHGSGGVRALAAFVLGGRRHFATGGDDDRVRLRAGGAAGAELRVAGPVRALAAKVTDDAVELAAGADDGRVTIWTLEPGQLSAGTEQSLARELEGPTDWIRTVALLGEGEDAQVAAGAEDGGVYLWPTSAASGSAGPRLGGRGPAVLAAAVLPDPLGEAVLATGGRDSAVTLWSADGNRAGEPLAGDRAGAVCGLTAYRLGDKTSIASADEGGVRIWTPGGGAEPGEASPSGPVVAVAACPTSHGTLAVTGDAVGTVRLWEPDSGKPRTPPHRAEPPATARVIAPYPLHETGTVLAIGGDDELVRFVDASTGKPVEGLAQLQGHTGPVRALSFESEGAAIVSGGEDGTVRLWDAAHVEIAGRTSRPGAPVRGLQALRLPDHGDCLAVVGHGRGLEVRLASDPSQVVASCEDHVDWAMAVAVQPRALAPLIITCGDDGAVWAYDLFAGERPELLGRHDAPVRALAVLGGDKHLLASGGADDTVRLWDPSAAPHARGCMRIGAGVNAICALGDRLLVGTDEGHVVIDLTPG